MVFFYSMLDAPHFQQSRIENAYAIDSILVDICLNIEK